MKPPSKFTRMESNHIKQWKHNRNFVSTIDPEYPDWAITAVFYTALHVVDALLEYDEVEGITSHSTRNTTLCRTSRYAKIWQCYQPLHGLSQTVRYLANPRKWVPWERVEREVVHRYLYPIEKSVHKLINQTPPNEPVSLKSRPAGKIN